MVEVLHARRVVARSSALDHAHWPAGAVVLRFAPDDVMVLGEGEFEVGDPHAIVEADGFCGMRMTEQAVVNLLSHSANWHLPDMRPCLAQGMMAGLPIKIWIDQGEALVMTPTPFAVELEERLR